MRVCLQAGLSARRRSSSSRARASTAAATRVRPFFSTLALQMPASTFPAQRAPVLLFRFFYFYKKVQVTIFYFHKKVQVTICFYNTHALVYTL